MGNVKQGGGQSSGIDTVKDILNKYLPQIANQKKVFNGIVHNDDSPGNQKLRDKYIVAIAIILSDLNFLRSYNNSLYVYCSTHWKIVEQGALMDFLKNVLEKLGLNGLAWQYFRFLQDLQNQLLTTLCVSLELNKKVVSLNLLNGTLDVDPKTGNVLLRNHEKEDFFTYVLNYNHDPKAKAPEFEKRQNENLPDKIVQMVLLEFIASAFIPNEILKLEKALFLFGKGANGKSVIFEIVQALLGVENVSNYSLEGLSAPNSYERAEIDGKLLNYCSEITSKLHEENAKRLISGEPIEARRVYQNPFIIHRIPKIIVNTNRLPETKDFSDGFFRRVKIIEFNNQIPEHKQDKNLATKIIESELPGIFNLVVEALKRVLAQKNFTESEAIERAGRNYRNSQDEVRFWLNETSFEPSESEFITLQQAYDGYQTWCLLNGYKLKQANKSQFKDRLQGMGLTVMRKTVGWVVYLKEKSK